MKKKMKMNGNDPPKLIAEKIPIIIKKNSMKANITNLIGVAEIEVFISES